MGAKCSSTTVTGYIKEKNPHTALIQGDSRSTFGVRAPEKEKNKKEKEIQWKRLPCWILAVLPILKKCILPLSLC